MIRLNNAPNEGSTVKVNLGFRDSSGQYYIPAKIYYTLLALNSDKESWSVVGDFYEVPLVPASSVVLTIPDISLISGTTLQRKVMVHWEAYVDGLYSTFTDEIDFEIAPKPYVPNPPAPRPQPPVYVAVNSASLQIGALTAAPIMPVFILKTNLPVKIDLASANIKSGSLLLPCSMSVDEGGAVVTVAAERELAYVTSYSLIVEGLVSTINGYVMKEPFELSFATCREDTPPYVPVIQDKKEVRFDDNGTFTVEPDEGYDAIQTVEVSVEVPVPEIESDKLATIDVGEYSSPVQIVSDKDGMKQATVTLTNIPNILYAWKDAEATPDAHYLYTTYPNTSKWTGTAYQCGTTKNALLQVKNVLVNGEGLYVSGYAQNLYFRDPSNDIHG